MFYKEGNKYFPNNTDIIPIMPLGIYMCKYNDRKYTIESLRISDSFTIPDNNIESIEDSIFKSVIVKDFENTEKNIGVLLNGVKGTGKTLLAEKICNELKLPVFVLTELLPKSMLEEFFNSLTQKCVIFIDEYDKEYGQSDTLLSVMDGALKPKHPVLFLLTSNELEINKNMINRPNRILYRRNYFGLDLDVSKQLVMTYVKNESRANEASELVNKIDLLTYDVLFNFINTINNHEDVEVKVLFSFLNISKKENNSFGLSSK